MGVQTIDRITASVDRGRAFVATSNKVVLSGGADLLYLLVGANKKVRLTRVIFGCDSGKGVLYISTNITGTITGTAVTPINRYIGKGATSTCTVYKSVGGVSTKDIVHTVPFASAFILDLGAGLVLSAGAKLLISLDLTGTDVNVAADIEWSEDDA